MELRPMSRTVQEQLAATAAVADEPTRRAAELLSVSLDPALRLALQEAIGRVAAEVSAQLAPGRVDLSLRGDELEVQVVPPTTADPPAPAAPPAPEPAPAAEEPPVDDAASRVSFRPPQHLKSRLERAAEAQGLSMNAYLVRALTAHLHASRPEDPSARTSSRHGTGRTSGWYI